MLYLVVHEYRQSKQGSYNRMLNKIRNTWKRQVQTENISTKEKKGTEN